MKTNIRLLAAALIFLALPICYAQDEDPAEVMLFGVFHFANPGLDVIKTDQINVMTEGNQAYLEKLADRLSEFNPTKILLEYEPSRDPALQQRYTAYLNGKYELPSNEVYQLGFRIAARSDAETVHGFDVRSINWEAEPLFAFLEEVDRETGAKVSKMNQAIQAEMTLSLRELLQQSNDAEQDMKNRASYLMTNHVGSDDNLVGAKATASWWHRNFAMYALVQRHAQPGERVLVIGGQGHIAILRVLLNDDLDRKAVDVSKYF
jgi:hypothetical protein